MVKVIVIAGYRELEPKKFDPLDPRPCTVCISLEDLSYLIEFNVDQFLSNAGSFQNSVVARIDRSIDRFLAQCAAPDKLFYGMEVEVTTLCMRMHSSGGRENVDSSSQ